MKLKINLNSLIYLLLNIIIILPIFIMLDRDCNKYIVVVSIIQLILSIRQFKRIGIPYLSLQVLFITLSTIFHFGQAYLLAIGKSELFRYTNIDLARSMQTYNKANIFALLIQAFVVFGILIISKNFKKRAASVDINNKINDKNELLRVYQIGIILFCISIIPNFIYYYSQIKIISSGGAYAGIRDAIDYGPLMLLKLFYQPSIFMMLIGSKNKLKRARIIIIFAIIFEIFCMLSGNRAQQILMIISLIFIYYRVIKNLKISKIIIYLVLGYFFITFLYFISAYRNFDIFDPVLFKKRLMDVLEGGPVYDLLAQLGSNLNVVVLSLVSIPSYKPYNLGLTYIISWLSIYPNTGGLLGNIPNMYVFLNYLDTSLPLGGSYIGELYFNFGWFSIIFAIIVGIFIGYVGNKIEYFILNKNWLKLSIYMVLFSKLLWWIRDYFSSWIYAFFWSSLVIYLLNNLLNKIVKKKG